MSKLPPEWKAFVAAAYRAGRLERAVGDAGILREQLAKAKRQEQRVTLAIAIRAIERGRNLTDAEQMKNLMDGLAEFEREEAARVNSLKEENQNDLP
jgi:hypothetical protein